MMLVKQPVTAWIRQEHRRVTLSLRRSWFRSDLLRRNSQVAGIQVPSPSASTSWIGNSGGEHVDSDAFRNMLSRYPSVSLWPVSCRLRRLLPAEIQNPNILPLAECLYHQSNPSGFPVCREGGRYNPNSRVRKSREPCSGQKTDLSRLIGHSLHWFSPPGILAYARPCSTVLDYSTCTLPS